MTQTEEHLEERVEAVRKLLQEFKVERLIGAGVPYWHARPSRCHTLRTPLAP